VISRKKAVLVAAGTVAVAAITLTAPSASAVEVPARTIIDCQSASFYTGYDYSTRSVWGFKRTLYYGDGVGHTPGKHVVTDTGWAATQDFGPNDWGYVRYECLGWY